MKWLQNEKSGLGATFIMNSLGYLRLLRRLFRKRLLSVLTSFWRADINSV